MALLFCDNFENWESSDNNYPGPWIAATGAIRVNTGAGAGGYATASGTAVLWSLRQGFPNTSTVIVNTKQAGYLGDGSNQTALLWFMDETTIQLSVIRKTNGYFAVLRGNHTGVELGESQNLYPLNIDEELDIECKATFHNTTGSVELRINGITEINLTNVNTRSSSNNFANQVRIGSGSNTSANIANKFKHFILMDTTGSTMNDFIGPVAVTSLRPNEDGHYDDWTPNTGNRFAAVNQAVTDGDTTYVTADTATDKVSFKLGNLPAGVTDVFGVFAQAQIKREAETTRIARMFLRSGVDDEPIGTAQGIGPTYAFRNAAVTVSPFTTNAFDVAEINDIELGMEITT